MVLEALHEARDFTDIEKSLASIMLSYGEEFSYLSIRQFAEIAYTSTTTIQRFCQKIGCTSFKDMKIRFLKEYTAASHELGVIDVNRPFHFGAQASVIAGNLARVHERAVQETLNTLDYDAINKAVDLIRSSKTLYLFGHGDSGVTARAFLNRLMKIGKTAVLTSLFGEDSTYSVAVDPDCAALFITYRGSNLTFERSARILKSRNIPFIVLTSAKKTFLTENAAVCLRIPAFETQSDNIATYYSQEAFAYYLNLLYSVLYARNYSENKARKNRVDKVTSGPEIL